ncbi:conjugal transfer protein [Pseudomonas protegens]|uniref:Conjugal transfer protein n=1 Tax=Pseudomonas protegens TaxID=380021 RepID=A0A2T6GBG4_9PSED|nr:type IV secretory system conjugative DNA transfer family protein [Pseudomonas protegens]PUA41493.1 conjugal transfer protein [Pseudomonas protegens]
MGKAASQYSPLHPQKRIDRHPPLILGKHPHKDSFLATYGQTFVMLAAPPGSGKGVGIVFPNLLSYPDSVVVNDPKFENWEGTAGFRAVMGQKVFRFSPERLETHRWNPLSGLRRDPLYRLGDIRSLASVLFVSDNPKNQEWYNKASNVFAALVLYLMETPELPCTLPQLYEIAALGTGLGQWAHQIVGERSEGQHALSDECRRELNSVYIASQNKSSGWSTTSDIVRDVLAMYGEKTVAWALSGNDIDFSRLRAEKTSVYFCVSNNALKKFAPLMNLFFSQAIHENSTVLPEQGGHCPDGSLRLKHQLLFLIDEIAVMGRMEIMETAPALMRGAGLRFLIIFQNKEQLRAERTYGREGGDGIMKAFHAEIVYTPNDIKLATEYSDRLGKTTVRVPSTSVNYGDRRSRSKSYSLQPRPLMLPQEVNELPYEEELIFISATKEHPALNIRAKKIFWYEEPVFIERAGLPLPVLPTADLAKLATITVAVRIEEKTVEVVAPHDQAFVQEQQKRDAAPTGGGNDDARGGV